MDMHFSSLIKQERMKKRKSLLHLVWTGWPHIPIQERCLEIDGACIFARGSGERGGKLHIVFAVQGVMSKGCWVVVGDPSSAS